GAELVVGLLPGADVAHPRLHEAALVARREMREIEHAVQIGTHLDQHAPLHPRRLYGAHKVSLPAACRNLKRSTDKCYDRRYALRPAARPPRLAGTAGTPRRAARERL